MAGAPKQISIEDVYSLLIKINNNRTQSIEGIEQKISGLIKQIDIQNDQLNTRASKIEEENAILKQKLKNVERKLKSKNLIFYGVEDNKETDESLLDLVIKIITNQLKITNFHRNEITNAYRIGKKSHTPRPILVEFTSQFTRKEIIRRRTQLKGTRIYISEDLTDEDRVERKALTEVLKQAKQDQKRAYLRGNILVVEGTSYTYQDILQEKHLITAFSNDYYSPPLPRNAISGPSTPVNDLEEYIDVEENKTTQQSDEERTEKTDTKVQEDNEIETERRLIETLEKITGAKPKKINSTQTQQRPFTRNRLLSIQHLQK